MTTMKTRAWLLFASALAMGSCGDSGDFTYMDDDVPSGRCDTDGSTDRCAATSGTGTTQANDDGVGAACSRSKDCEDGLICSAPFTQGERGAFACVEACITNMDDFRWCADARGCCDPNAVCTARGYCIEDTPGHTTDDDGSTSATSSHETSGDDTQGSTSGTSEESTSGESSTDDAGTQSTGMDSR